MSFNKPEGGNANEDFINVLLLLFVVFLVIVAA